MCGNYLATLCVCVVPIVLPLLFVCICVVCMERPYIMR